MKRIITLFFFLIFTSITAQNEAIDLRRKVEDKNGRIITDLKEKEAHLRNLQNKVKAEKKSHLSKASAQPLVHLCNNGGFEEFEPGFGSNVLKYYKYTESDPLNPTQCVSSDVVSDQDIYQYDPGVTNVMATTVPSNFVDEFIGDIAAFDQYTLKVNHRNSSQTSAIVQTKRFKTNNEDHVEFNYKEVLQSITESAHLNEQPFFKARIIDINGNVVSEFCSIGDPTNCIFTQSPVLQSGSIILYTQNWQSGILDISSIPNNEEFTIEFTAARCGLGAHFGYAYVDDICLLHSDENLQGSIKLDPLFQICPTLPISVCGDFTIPNSGGISATVDSITMNVYDAVTNNVVFTSSIPTTLDLVTKRFCFQLVTGNLPNINSGNYNVGVVINYGLTQTNCAGTNFASASDNDANSGSDILFMNCSPNCDFTLQTGSIMQCDTNDDGKEFFDLSTVNSQITGVQTGLTYSYFKNFADASNNINEIINFINHESYTSTIFIRVNKSPTCFKIIAFDVIVKNPSATISGILNVCSGSTTLTASPGAGYLWSNGDTTQSTVITSNGTYSVIVTDANGCISSASVDIIPNSVAVLPTIQVTQPTCLVSTGTITVVSPASEYSYDDGLTWTTNSQMTNVAVGNYYVKIKTVTGCISYSSLISINPYSSSFPYYTNINPTDCNGLGSITITSTSDFYSFDDGVTWTTNNTADNLPIGTYLIRTKNSLGCISNYNSVVLNGQFLPSPLCTIDHPYCLNQGSITITSIADEYSFDGGTTWQTSNTKSNLNAGSYIIKIRTAQGCTSPNFYVYLIDFESTSPSYSVDDAGCAKYATLTITTPADFYSFDNGATWSTNNTITGLNGGTSYQIKVRKGTNCDSYSTTAYINSYYRPLPAVSNYSTLICDDLHNRNENVNLALYNSNLISNPGNYTIRYYNTLNGAENQISTEEITNFNSYNLNVILKTIYVRITDSYGCTSIANLELNLIKAPIITLADHYYLCQNSTVTISEISGFDSYLWSNGATTQSITVSQPGNYSLTVTENHGAIVCTSIKTFPVILSSIPVITHFNIEDWTTNDNVITVNVNGLGDYQYSLDGIRYQDSNVFYGLEQGEHTVYVRDKHGCGVDSDLVYLLIYPKYFTPNGDGYHDYWKIKFSEKESNQTVKIFDRHGKFIKQIDPNGPGWDGTYQNEPMPSADYWFTITRQNGKKHTEHFTLKR